MANRVSETVSKVPAEHRRHVPTRVNPADLASRGMMPAELIQNNLLCTWLKMTPESWPHRSFCNRKVTLPELKKTFPTLLSIPKDDFWYHYSSYHHLLRITACLLCFIHDCRSLNIERVFSPLLTAADTIKAEKALFPLQQKQVFPQELTALTNSNCHRQNLLATSFVSVFF